MSQISVEYNVNGIQGLNLIKPKCFKDVRGYFAETYNAEEFKSNGLTKNFVQDNQVFSYVGVLRGLHVNIRHPQGKLIRVVQGEIFDVAIDLRRNSRTFMNCYTVRLNSENQKQLYIPEGFGHGYYTISNAVVLFKVTTHYITGDEIGFAWNSKAFNINWPINKNHDFIISDMDKNNPEFNIEMLEGDKDECTVHM